MNQYDIVFIGHMSIGTIVPFEGSSYIERGSPAHYAAIAASSLGKRISVATRISEGEDYLLEPMRAAGIDLLVQPGDIARYRLVFPTANVDERQIFRENVFGPIIAVDDLLSIEPCLTHLCWIGPRESQLDLMRALKERGFRLSVDMQNFVLQAQHETGTGAVCLPEKEEIVNMADFVKLDAMEAKVLTGASVLQDQADILEHWGGSEIIITSSEGALARSKGNTTLAKFTNRNTRGRMGRGDTVMGSYLARRMDHSVEESLRFAVALASIKLESIGPFNGSLDDVIARMDAARDHRDPFTGSK